MIPGRSPPSRRHARVPPTAPSGDGTTARCAFVSPPAPSGDRAPVPSPVGAWAGTWHSATLVDATARERMLRRDAVHRCPRAADRPARGTARRAVGADAGPRRDGRLADL